MPQAIESMGGILLEKRFGLSFATFGCKIDGIGNADAAREGVEMTSRTRTVVGFLLAGLAWAPLVATAETRGKPQAEEVALVVTCGDLRSEVAATHPECQPRRAAPAQRVQVVSDRDATPAPRRIKALPWLIGVYN